MAIFTKETLIIIVASSAIASVIGGFAGYKAAMSAPVQSQFAIVDLVAIAKEAGKTIDANTPSGKMQLAAHAEAIKRTLTDLTDQGVVILDAGSVIAAPAASYISPDPVTK